MEITTKTDKETYAFAKKFAKELKGGEVLGLIGDLGAGKTVFTQGLAAGLGVKEVVNSPTFVFMKIYDITKSQNKALKKLVHIDAYRIKSEQDMVAIGAKDYFGRDDTVVVIEWADYLKKIMPEKTQFISIEIKDSKRVIKS